MKYQEFWYDIDSDKRYLVHEGSKTQCNDLGIEAKFFVPFCSGFMSYKNRIDLSKSTGQKHLIPPKPPCYIENIAIKDPAKYSGIKRLDGCTQFPHPLLEIPRSSVCKTMAPMVLKKTPSWGFISQQASIMAQEKSPQIINSIQSTFEPTLEESGLQSKKLLRGSRIKADYASSLKSTFKTSVEFDKNLEKILEDDRKENGNDDVHDKLVRSYKDFRKLLKKEEVESCGYQEPPEKKEKMNQLFYRKNKDL